MPSFTHEELIELQNALGQYIASHPHALSYPVSPETAASALTKLEAYAASQRQESPRRRHSQLALRAALASTENVLKRSKGT